ncbi:DUF5994 family protein [Mycolicibacterium aubagnense]|uniref:DUF5994 family protein n=1 Tax=Mycolicibacterium aubagnense TaxID=319707 RepID=UPI0010FDFC1A|nr:DUF5994 family protein [Mycolicibacterium aubagnense]TLH57709.1 hypothetical protein C1S80_21660 [Mycolicibacterium aubagnense]WGI34100.1 DUF5994 family protein [Mycolicibacterium aubagnense]
MTPHEHRTSLAERTSPKQTPRLRLKPKAPHSGFVDGAWWPHTSNLSNELPDLLAVLSVRLGRIDRVLYKVDEWSQAPTKLATGGRRVHLDGYRRQPRNTIEIVGLDRDNIVLLTVPANTDAAEAHSALMSAALPNNRSTVLDILTTAQHAD